MKKQATFDKSYLMRIGLYVLAAALAFGIIVYLAYHMIGRFSPGLELVDAVPTSVSRTVTAYAYLMRDEKAIFASGVSAGSVAPAVRDGAHVSIYSKIADVYANSSPDTEARLNELDEQIALLEKNRSDNRSVQSTAGLDADIYSELFTIRSYCEEGSYVDALSLRTKLLVSIKKRAILTGEITDYSSHIAMLEGEKASLRATLGACLETVYSPSAGYYFSGWDGYESIFSSAAIDSMTFDDFLQKTEAEPETESGLCVGTLVSDYKWYIACLMDKTDAAGLVDRYTCSVMFRYSGETLDMELYRIIPETPGERAVVVLRCGKMPVNFDYTRMQPVDIVTAEYTGYEIPSSAVRVVDGFEGVYVKNQVTIEFRRIYILYDNDGTVICSGKPDSMKYEQNADGTYKLDDNGNRIEINDLNDEIYPWIAQNDIVVVSGTELYTGKTVDDRN
ncbi:MAG: HlyD family efflux transporter periplasmic adaptor subunit [Eubacteriales bacterium]